jgi:DnaK suppressor protein
MLVESGQRCDSRERLGNESPTKAYGHESEATTLDDDRARQLLHAERERLLRLMGDTQQAQQLDHAQVQETTDPADAAQALTAGGLDDAFASDLRERLAALDRAEQRLDRGVYGRSLRSGLLIPDDRLAADPAAELTVEEAEAGD